MIKQINKFLTTSVCILSLSSTVVLAHGDKISHHLSLKNATQLSANYVTGGQPSVKDLQELASHGNKVVINLRGEGEFEGFDEKNVVDSLGMTYVSIPVSGAGDVNFENVAKFHEVLSKSSDKTLVHCASGNRVGAFFALEAFKYGGKSAEEALEIGRAAGLTRLEGKVKALMAEN